MLHFQKPSGVSAKCRDTRVEELWGLTSFFGYSTQTFVQAVNLLDRFLAIMKVGVLSNVKCFSKSQHKSVYCVFLVYHVPITSVTNNPFDLMRHWLTPIAVVLLWQVQPKHLPCIGVCCLYMASKLVEEESNVSPTHELIRISQSKFTVSDLCRMEKIISEKLSVEPNAVTALTFLHLYYSAFTTLSAGR